MIYIDNEDWSDDPLNFACHYTIHSEAWELRTWCGENFGGYYLDEDYGERWRWQATGDNGIGGGSI